VLSRLAISPPGAGRPALAELLRPVPDAARRGLPPLQRAALEEALRGDGVAGSPQRFRAVATATLALLETIAWERPVVVAVGDPASLDALTAGVLAFCARRLRGRIGLLAVRAPGARRAGRPDDARAALEHALERFPTAGSPLWAAPTTEPLRLRPAPAPRDALTPDEERTADLAATGLTNREIAARLHISPKTVEARLRRAYRKLGIRSRAQLGARMGRRATRDAQGRAA